jgi:hypothetical protein
MSCCSRCGSELPEGAKFCNNCGLSQTNPILVAIPRVQKEIQIGKIDEGQIPETPRLSLDDSTLSTTKPESTPETPRLSLDDEVLPTAKTQAIRPVKANKPIQNQNRSKIGTMSQARIPAMKARFTRDTGPIYIGKVVSVGRKPFRRNLLLTRVGLYVTLVILTCLIIGIGFTLAYVVLHQTH